MWKSVSCEVQGKGHIKTNTPCQDKTITLDRNGVQFIALADGAGSARFSHYGAREVVNCAAMYITDNFSRLIENDDGKQVKQEILDIIRNSLDATSAIHECSLSDLASTLLAVAVFEDNYLIVHVGDGVIGYLNGSQLKTASIPENGEFANVTTFVTSKDAIHSMRLYKGRVKDISGFVLMSDGTEQSLYHKPTKTLAKAIIKLMQRTCLLEANVIKEQLHSTFNAVITQNTQDDCSIALLVRPIGVLRDYTTLDMTEKCDVIGLCTQSTSTKKRLSWFDDVVQFLETPRKLKCIARYMRLKPKHTQKRLQKLVECGLIAKHGEAYTSRT
ncbi:MAG: protein phosphatase 2C domain-containing protein [Defluviitaleaceae bacterium]|nr:protein phosphatase 2C domain-containing protein [Defluviitaleaceae bacterium]